MTTPKYKKMFEDMLQTNKQLFSDYNELLAKYDLDKSKYAQELSDMQRILFGKLKNSFYDKVCFLRKAELFSQINPFSVVLLAT